MVKLLFAASATLLISFLMVASAHADYNVRIGCGGIYSNRLPQDRAVRTSLSECEQCKNLPEDCVQAGGKITHTEPCRVMGVGSSRERGEVAVSAVGRFVCACPTWECQFMIHSAPRPATGWGLSK